QMIHPCRTPRAYCPLGILEEGAEGIARQTIAASRVVGRVAHNAENTMICRPHPEHIVAVDKKGCNIRVVEDYLRKVSCHPFLLFKMVELQKRPRPVAGGPNRT